MGSSYLPPPEQNVVNVGDEISASALAGLQYASPSGSQTNPFATNQSVATAISAIPLPPPPNLSAYAQLAGATFTGKITGTATATTAGVNLGTVSAAPTSLANGDIFITDRLQFINRFGNQIGVVSTNQSNTIQTGHATAAVLTVWQSSNGGALRVVNTGTGDSFRVEDESPESSPFVIDANGKVGIGGVVPTGATDKVAVHGGNIVFAWPYGIRLGDGTSINSTSSIRNIVSAFLFGGGDVYNASNQPVSLSDQWQDAYGNYIPFTYTTYTESYAIRWNDGAGAFQKFPAGDIQYPDASSVVGSFYDSDANLHQVFANGYGGYSYIS